ncbi:unnamed protein product [Musa acuminata subsp. malaccensis]|uniref:(wild Malaysian banana) hypothetical protein n=1 Tax=Musa acuminata subsp. malaccensis TaxID=214687 RepID=A0A804HQ11_MUSAM|nr:unnamed protein product [Musa acuminata subsp. malaccensis]
MKERLCLEVERLGPSAVIMGSRGFGDARRTDKGRLGSVSDYCVHHCACPVVVVRCPDEGNGNAEAAGGSPVDDDAAPARGTEEKQVKLHLELEVDDEYHDTSIEHKG